MDTVVTAIRANDQGCIFFHGFEKLPGAAIEKLPDSNLAGKSHQNIGLATDVSSAKKENKK